ncbi:hypothetical protein [Specibacter sp. RAF43]|uniref:hypothetical protein n=1 Tax=Specibacter sp. RAF43 TaxID=3233057 RepID=UPI003F99B82D
MTAQQPQDYATRAQEPTAIPAEWPADTAERFAGYGILGVPFRSGHYLAFRHFPASSIGPGYRAVWLRRPDRQWTVYADAPPQLSCARYFGAALDAAVTTEATIGWDSPSAATIAVPGILDWRIELAPSPTTRAISALAPRMPARWWRDERVLRAMGAMTGPLLRAGKLRFSGVVPNGQTFQARPLRVWTVRSAAATIDGLDAGTPAPLPEQEHLGGFWLPQRGLFVADLGVRFPSTAGTAQRPEISTETRASRP